MPGGIAHYKRMVGDILCDHRPGTDEGILADRVSADDRAVGPQGGTFLHVGRSYLVHFRDLRPRVVDVRENHRRTAENAVLDGDAFINADIVLDLAFAADGHIGTDNDVLADVAVLADL